MTSGERMWLWAQPLLAILAAVAGVAAWVVQALGAYAFLPSVQAVVTGSFVLPGLAVSLGINHLIVMARRPPVLTSGEKILLGVQALLVVVTVLTSLDPAALIGGFLLWPLLIAAAVTACVTMARTTLQMRRGAYALVVESGVSPAP
ncbi:hypothetical protein EV140_2630 [Microcella alkaliphila]|uniref:Uncharacterized protein n=1 Tax=Microcella alkaliphila TaxID=279828 RepID=A0A4Q7TBD5_9MICO|nr:hypothetical protein [Microcella alkaliphila]RZT55962.1 hypothetical protein EV140_2630 [Microcella alkaliphila]